MGNKDFIKGILERKGKVHFGRVRHTALRPMLHTHAEVVLSCTTSAVTQLYMCGCR